MRQLEKARPGACWQGGGRGTTAVGNGHMDYIMGDEPVALKVFKRNDWLTVAKITFLDGKPVLAVAHKTQRGVRSAISIPVVALEYALRRGCEWLFFRRDETRQMWRLRLDDLTSGTGWLAESFGVSEWFVRVDSMKPVRWRRWRYAELEVHLGPGPETGPGFVAAGELR